MGFEAPVWIDVAAHVDSAADQPALNAQTRSTSISARRPTFCTRHICRT